MHAEQSTSQGRQLLAGVSVPHLGETILTARGHKLPIRRERHSSDHSSVTRKPLQLATTRNLPNRHGSVVVSASQETPVGRKASCIGLLIYFPRGLFPPEIGFPTPDLPFTIHHEQLLASTGKVNIKGPAGAQGEVRQFASRRPIPDFAGSGLLCDNQTFGIGG